MLKLLEEIENSDSNAAKDDNEDENDCDDDADAMVDLTFNEEKLLRNIMDRVSVHPFNLNSVLASSMPTLTFFILSLFSSLSVSFIIRPKRKSFVKSISKPLIKRNLISSSMSSRQKTIMLMMTFRSLEIFFCHNFSSSL